MAINYGEKLQRRFRAAMSKHTPQNSNGPRLAEKIAETLLHPDRGGVEYPVTRCHVGPEHLVVSSGVATQPHFAYLKAVCETAGLTATENGQHELIITGGF